jgi:sugar phosphate isomerase/epimerase
MLKLATKFAPRPAALEAAHRAGFRYAELWLDAALLAEGPTVLRQARHYPFGYALHAPNRPDLDDRVLESAVALYRELGCRCLVIHQPVYDRHHRALLRLDPELRPAVENHDLAPDEFLAWAEGNPGLALDVEHLWKFTLRDAPLPELLAAVRRFLDRFGGKLRHVHLPGYWPGFAEHRPMYCAREMVFPVLSLLAEAGFEGQVVSEVNTEYQNDNDLRMDVLLFDAWRQRPGPGRLTSRDALDPLDRSCP